jgi:hypothetical protein
MLLICISPWEYWRLTGTYRGFAGMAERYVARSLLATLQPAIADMVK